jgi:DNA-binding helix-hairpin-helix protein with protein kinase domain
VDYFALGVILFEVMTGSRPYDGIDRAEVKKKILTF